MLAPGSTTPVANQLQWFTLSRDTERLRALLARTQHVAAFDNAGEMKENAVTREAEERTKADYAAQKASGRTRWPGSVVTRTNRRSRQRTCYWRGRCRLFELTPNGAIAEDSLAELRKVEAAWNGLDVRDTVASMFVALAVLELGAEQSELLHSYAKLSRHHSLHTLLFVLERDHQTEYQRLKSNPRISEAASALKRASEEVVSDAAYGLGIMSGMSIFRQPVDGIFSLSPSDLLPSCGHSSRHMTRQSRRKRSSSVRWVRDAVCVHLVGRASAI